MVDQRPRRIRKVVKVLTDPNPEFVSMVPNGANQIPFQVLKSAEGRIVENTASDTLAQKTGATVVEIKEWAFDKSIFTTEDSVKEYLDHRGYSNYEIVDVSNTVFVVPGSERDLKDLEQIPAIKGVVMTVGTLDDDVIEPVQRISDSAREKAKDKGDTEADGSYPIRNRSDLRKAVRAYGRSKNKAKTKSWIIKRAKALGATDLLPKDWSGSTKKFVLDVVGSEIVKRYDSWMASYSDDKTVGGVIADGSTNDGFPPGFTEIAGAFVTALRNSLREDDEEAIRALGVEFIDILIELVSLFRDMEPESVEKYCEESTMVDNTAGTVVDPKITEEAAKAEAEKKAAEVAAADLAAKAKDGKDGDGKDGKDKEKDGKDKMKDGKDGKGGDCAKTAEVTPAVDIGATVAKAVAEALAPVIKAQTDFIEAMKVSGTFPARKSADAGEAASHADATVSVSKEDQERSRKMQERQTRNILGV